MISPRDFRTFVKPYLKRIADWQIEHIGAAGNLHICGDSHPLWDDMAELGFSSVSLDNAMDLAEAKMVMGNKVALKVTLNRLKPCFMVLQKRYCRLPGMY